MINIDNRANRYEIVYFSIFQPEVGGDQPLVCYSVGVRYAQFLEHIADLISP